MLMGLRQRARAIRRRLRPARPEGPPESRRELSERYLRELEELVADREISPEFAKRVRDDMFQEGGPGEPPRLRLAYWRSHLKEKTGQDGPRLVLPLPKTSGGRRRD